MRNKKDRYAFAEALCIMALLFGYLCFVSFPSFCGESSDGGSSLRLNRQVAVCVESCFEREEHCSRRSVEGGNIPKAISSASFFEYIDYISSLKALGACVLPEHSVQIFYLRHIPVRAGPRFEG